MTSPAIQQHVNDVLATDHPGERAQKISAGRELLEYPRPDGLNGEALEEQLCAALDLPDELVDVGLSGDVLQVGVPKGIRKAAVDAVVRRHDGARAGDAWLKRRRMA